MSAGSPLNEHIKFPQAHPLVVIVAESFKKSTLGLHGEVFGDGCDR